MSRRGYVRHMAPPKRVLPAPTVVPVPSLGAEDVLVDDEGIV